MAQHALDTHLCDISPELETILLDEQARSNGWSCHAEYLAAVNYYYDNFIPPVPTEPTALRDYLDIPF